jgi:hypothetical protein
MIGNAPTSTNLNSKKLQGLARRRRMNQIAGNATVKNGLQRTTTSLSPAFNIVNQSRRSSGLVNQGQYRDASFRQAAQNREDRLEDQQYKRGIDQRNFEISLENNDRSFGLKERAFEASREDAQFNKDLAKQKVGLAQNSQEFSQGIQKERLGLAKDAQGLNEKRFEEDNRRFDETNNTRREIAGLQAEAEKRKSDLNRIDKLDDGYLEARAKHLGIDTSKFIDESGNFTREGDRYFGTVKELMKNGLSEVDAVKQAGSDILGNNQSNIQNRINELENLGEDISGDEKIELEDAKRSIHENASHLYRVNPNARNPERDKQVAKLQQGVQGALDVAGNFKGDDPVSIARRGVEVQEFLNQQGIDLSQVNIGNSTQGNQILEMVKQADPKLIELSEAVKRERNALGTSRGLARTFESPSTLGGGLMLAKSLQNSNPKRLQEAERKLQEYLGKKKGGAQ